MIKSFIQTAIRNMIRERYYAVIKVVGLAIGLGTSLVIFLYVAHQLSYDRTHPDVERTYRVDQTNIWSSGMFGSTGPVIASVLSEDFPEVQEVTRINTPGGNIVRYIRSNGEVVSFNEENVLAADSNFFSFFDFPLKEGDSKNALIGKNKVVLSDKAAKRLFGNEQAVGKIIQFGDDRIAVEVTGVTQEQATNIHFHFDYLLSIQTNPAVKRFDWSWIWTQVVTYVKLKPGADPDALAAKLDAEGQRRLPVSFNFMGIDFKEFMRNKGEWHFALLPVVDIHLFSNQSWNRIGPTGDITYVYIFSVVAIFVLLIAIINFINLSTARATKRAKEVGVKKTLGMNRGALILQFQIEYMVITFIAMLLGLGVMELLRISIQPLAGIEVPLMTANKVVFGALLIGLPVVIGFLAGLYPAFYLTAFQPAQVLKGKLSAGLRNSGLRNVLVIVQFTISIGLMAATLLVFQQLRYFQNMSLGFDRENLLIIDNADKLGKQAESFRDEISQFEGVSDAAFSMDLRGSFEDIFMREGDNRQVSISQIKVDEHFVSTLKLSMAAGKSFTDDSPSEYESVVINETTARVFGWTPEEAIGQRIIYPGDNGGPHEIIGVVKDFHFQSLRQQVAPVMFFHNKSRMWGIGGIITVKFKTEDINKLLTHLETRWKQVADATPFEYSFFDEDLNRQYDEERKLGSLFSLFTGLSISIAIIGLVGLVAYSAEQRKKEIGVRKVFGASLTSIYMMMNKQYVRLMAIALVVSTPLVWWLFQKWLDTFAYRITISPWVFVLAGSVELILALICVAYLSLRAASLNPSAVLKEE